MCNFFPEGVSPSYAGLMPEVIASGKVVWGDQCTEGSQTAKSGTDEQNLHMMLFEEGKYFKLNCFYIRRTTAYVSKCAVACECFNFQSDSQ